MTPAHPTLFAAFITAYWDLSHVLRSLWRVMLIAFVIWFALLLAGQIVPLLLTRSPAGQILIKVLFDGLGVLFVTPACIAIHRFVLLGEVTNRYAVDLGSPRFQLFAGWLVVLALVLSIPSHLVTAITPTGLIESIGSPLPDPERHIVPMLARFAACLLAIPLTFLLPAVALDAPGAIWQNAVRDARGHEWFIFCASFLTCAPIGFLAGSVYPILRLVPGKMFVFILFFLTSMMLTLILVTLVLVVVSRLYQALGNRLNQPA